MKFLCVEEGPNNSLKVSVTKECFREAVKILLTTIPLGKVTSYSKIAEILRTHPRNIAKILKSNNEPLIVPCHRVVHNNRKLGGYTVNGISRPDLKKKLLLMEGIEIVNDKVLKKFFTDNLI